MQIFFFFNFSLTRKSKISIILYEKTKNEENIKKVGGIIIIFKHYRTRIWYRRKIWWLVYLERLYIFPVHVNQKKKRKKSKRKTRKIFLPKGQLCSIFPFFFDLFSLYVTQSLNAIVKYDFN